ncbi:hypothetical protein VTL71DRAFT_12948 [Oculimacula yallundae]|uniref:Uncharacterized protein n=1 Tax=Oculimacula yallundae TaxID=86028 RepID=A0ABR4CPQ6_9HELO
MSDSRKRKRAGSEASGVTVRPCKDGRFNLQSAGSAANLSSPLSQLCLRCSQIDFDSFIEPGWHYDPSIDLSQMSSMDSASCVLCKLLDNQTPKTRNSLSRFEMKFRPSDNHWTARTHCDSYMSCRGMWGALAHLVLQRPNKKVIRRLQCDSIDFGIVREWMKNCHNNHKTSCGRVERAQNRIEELQYQVGMMDGIYKKSELTIITAAGDDPSYGLPGEMYCCETLDLPFEGQDYSSLRDFQSLYRDGRYGSTGTRAGYFPHGVGNQQWSILDRITEYSKRSLAKDTDTLNGFMGILRVFGTQLGLQHLQGIPFLPPRPLKYLEPPTPDQAEHALAGGFIAGLLWQPESPTSRRNEFPSWCPGQAGTDRAIGLAKHKTGRTLRKTIFWISN